MELDAYLRALLRHWYVPIILVAIAVFGVWTYHRFTDTETAKATLVVLSAPRPVPGEFLPAQIGFDTIDESNQLAARVAARLDDGTTADEIKGKISVDVRRDLNAVGRSSLFTVSGQDEDKERAVVIADLAAEEARHLFAEINSFDSKDVRLAFQGELDRAEAEAATAREQLVQFLGENDAYALPTRIDHQLALVSQLRLSGRSPDSAQEGATSSGDGPSLEEARTELQRLAALEPEYNGLVFDVQLAQNAVSRLEARVSDLEAAGPGFEVALANARTQLDSAEARLAHDQGALSSFQQTNAVSDVPAAVQSQLALVNQLAVSQASSRASATAAQDALAAEDAELERLLGLESEYDLLNVDLENAEARRATLEQRVLDVIAGRTLPAEAQVKLLDAAETQSNFFWDALTYALGVTVAILFSITIIYLFALFERVAPSVQELEEIFDQPVITQVPKQTI